MTSFKHPSLISLSVSLLISLSLISCSPYDYVRVEESLPSGKQDNLTDEELEIEEVLKKTAAIPKCAEYFSQFFNNAYLIIQGFDNLCFTFSAGDNGASVKRGIDASVKPELIIDMNKQNCFNIFKIFEDGEVSDEEEYRIFYVTLIPSIKSATKMDALFDPFVAKKLALPNFIQMILKNENGYVYQNTTKEVKLTLVTVDGQWLVFEGAMGDPDVRMAFTSKQAVEYRKLMFKFTKEKDAPIEKKKKNLEELVAFLDKVTVYRRGQ